MKFKGLMEEDYLALLVTKVWLVHILENYFFLVPYIYIPSILEKIILPLIVLSLVTIILTNERSASIMFFTASLIFLTFF